MQLYIPEIVKNILNDGCESKTRLQHVENVKNICNSTERLDVGEKRQISVLKIQKYTHNFA